MEMKRVLAFILCACMIAGLAACGGGNQGATTQAAQTQAQTEAQTQAAAAEATTEAATDVAAETTTTAATTAAAATAAAAVADSGQSHQDITFYHWGEKPNQMDDVMNKFNETGGVELNMTWKTNWTPLDDYSNMIKLKLSAGEQVDACFDAQWMMLLDFIREGNYHDMSPYFMNPEYPGLQAAFDSNFLYNNMFGTGKTYGVPIAQAYGTAPLVLIRADLREQYGVPPVNTLQEYEAFLEAIKANEPNMIPLTTNIKERHTDTIVNSENVLYINDEAAKAGVWTGIQIATDLNVNMYVKDYKIITCALTNEPASSYADFPAPYNQRNLGMDIKYASLARDYFEKGYLDPDFINVTSMAGVFTSGKAASMIWDTANYLSLVNTLKLAVSDAKVEVYQPSPIFREGLKGKNQGSFVAWNFMCVPITTSDEKFDRIMQFYEWMYSSWENHDLLELGIAGKNFEPIGNSQYRIPDGVDPATNYNLPGYQLTWNPNFIRLSEDMPADVVLYNQRGNDPETYYDPLFSGFAFDTASVETAIANPDLATYKDKVNNIRWGIIPNVQAAYDEVDAEISGNKNLAEDIGTIKQEVMKQAQEYLDVRKVEDAKRGVSW
jgi:putative aldouronate transport system substrate-binding protein